MAWKGFLTSLLVSPLTHLCLLPANMETTNLRYHVALDVYQYRMEEITVMKDDQGCVDMLQPTEVNIVRIFPSQILIDMLKHFI